MPFFVANRLYIHANSVNYKKNKTLWQGYTFVIHCIQNSLTGSVLTSYLAGPGKGLNLRTPTRD